MNNLHILYFTLGALAGLPMGWHLARMYTERVEPLVGCVLSVFEGVRGIDASLLLMVAAMDMDLEARRA